MSRRQWGLHDRGVKPNHSRSNSSRGPVRPVGITAAGAFLPKRTLSSDEIQDRVAGAYRLEVPPGTLERRTGISQRRIAGDDEYASTLAIGAARQAMAAARPGAGAFHRRF